MDTAYFGIIVFLFLLAIVDLMVGVSNDAVNFLNSAIGAKAANFKVIILVAAVGVFLGASTSNGMMEIARHGIFHPQYFYFNELMCICLAVMIADVILLDVFNSLGMPTSTTVSMVFELLGGTVALALIKLYGNDSGVGFGDLLNTEKALSVILGIFLSVAIAFVFGVIVQWITRLIFTFNYKKNLKWTIGIFGGLALTSIIYFVLVKGMESASFMAPNVQLFIQTHTWQIIIISFAFFTLLMQLLHMLKVNVLKLIVLSGTFALALAFAGNDLVNFIGVPLAGYDAYLDFSANGGDQMANEYLMGSLNSPAHTPLYFLIMAGGVMIIALVTSKKAHNVIKTSIDLSRQEAGDEMFGSSRLARSIVRSATTIGASVSGIFSPKVRLWINRRFNSAESIMETGASFDLIRASVNLTLASILIVLGTSLKLPLSTTYVTFMVAMGSSLADKAWGRESAVFRITGVISVIGGWLLTACIAFGLCFIIAIVMYFVGLPAMYGFIALVAFLLIRSHVMYSKHLRDEKKDEMFKQMLTVNDKQQVWTLMRSYFTNSMSETINFSATAYTNLVKGFMEEDVYLLRKIATKIDDRKKLQKKIRRREILALRRIDQNTALERTTWFHLAGNSAEQMVYCLLRISEPCIEHVDNSFNPMPENWKHEFLPISSQITSLMFRVQNALQSGKFEDIEDISSVCSHLHQTLSDLRQKQTDKIQTCDTSVSISIVYLNLIQESQEIVSATKHLARGCKRFLA